MRILLPAEGDGTGMLLDFAAAGDYPLPKVDFTPSPCVIFVYRSPRAVPVDNATLGLPPDAPVRILNFWDHRTPSCGLYTPLSSAIRALRDKPAAVKALLAWTEGNVFKSQPATALPVLDMSRFGDCPRMGPLFDALAARGLRVVFIAKASWQFVQAKTCQVLLASEQPDSPYVFIQRILESGASPADQRRVFECWLDHEPHLVLEGPKLAGLPLDHPLLRHALITSHGGTVPLKFPQAEAAPAHQHVVDTGAMAAKGVTTRIMATRAAPLSIESARVAAPSEAASRMVAPPVAAPRVARACAVAVDLRSASPRLEESAAADDTKTASADAPDGAASRPRLPPKPPESLLRRWLDALRASLRWLLSVCLRPFRRGFAQTKAETAP